MPRERTRGVSFIELFLLLRILPAVLPWPTDQCPDQYAQL